MNIFENLRNVVVRNLKGEPKMMISSETRLVEDLNFDSLRILQLLTDLEDEFDVFLPNTDLSKMKRVGDLELIIAQEKLTCT